MHVRSDVVNQNFEMQMDPRYMPVMLLDLHPGPVLANVCNSHPSCYNPRYRSSSYGKPNTKNHLKFILTGVTLFCSGPQNAPT